MHSGASQGQVSPAGWHGVLSHLLNWLTRERGFAERPSIDRVVGRVQGCELTHPGQFLPLATGSFLAFPSRRGGLGVSPKRVGTTNRRWHEGAHNADRDGSRSRPRGFGAERRAYAGALSAGRRRW